MEVKVPQAIVPGVVENLQFPESSGKIKARAEVFMITKIYSVFLVFALLLASAGEAEARWHHGWRRGFLVAGWDHGYWYHGTYGGRAGWWWIVGPGWYYYPQPLYPYPPATAEPLYIVQVPSQPPPASSSATVPPPAATVQRISGNDKAFTYYCEKTKAYYPVVTNCEAGWVATPVKGPQ